MSDVGVVLEAGGLRLLDTREMRWEEHPGIPGAKAKILSRDPEGWPSVLISWIPPGLKADGPKRHFHRTVLERGLVLTGELPMREFSGTEDAKGKPVTYREGHYFDRDPGSVHSLDWEAASPTGFSILEWRTGPGTYLHEDGADTETVVIRG